MTKVNKISVMLIAAIAAASILSCTKEENAATGNHAIGFRSNDVWTKAMVSGEDGLKNGGFHVYAQGTFDGTGGTYRFDRHVTFTDGGWNYKNLEYWLPTCSYVFRAYYPADLTVSKTGDAIQGFELESQYGTQTDVLMATASRSTAQIETAGTTVPLTFKHLLSNLDVKLTVESMQVDGVNTNAINANILAVAFSGTSRTADYKNGSWINHTGDLSVGDNMSGNVTLSWEKETSIFPNGLLVIPEELGHGDVTLYILANIGLPNGITMEKRWTLPVPEIEWEPGRRYTYTAKLTQTFNIEFDEPSVETWHGAPLSGTVIIR